MTISSVTWHIYKCTNSHYILCRPFFKQLSKSDTSLFLNYFNSNLPVPVPSQATSKTIGIEETYLANCFFNE